MGRPRTLYHHHVDTDTIKWVNAGWDRLHLLPGVTGVRVRFNVPGKLIAGRRTVERRNTGHVVHDYDHPTRPYRIVWLRCWSIIVPPDEEQDAAAEIRADHPHACIHNLHGTSAGFGTWDGDIDEDVEVEQTYDTPNEAIMAGIRTLYYEDAPLGVDG